MKPGGYFVFDVFTERYVGEEVRGNDWYEQERDGFWHPGPHLVLLQCHAYQHHDVHLKRYIIVPRLGRTRSFDAWYHHYDRGAVTKVVESAGWEVAGVYGDLTGAPFDPDGRWIGVVCRKPVSG